MSDNIFRVFIWINKDINQLEALIVEQNHIESKSSDAECIETIADPENPSKTKVEMTSNIKSITIIQTICSDSDESDTSCCSSEVDLNGSYKNIKRHERKNHWWIF